MTTPTARPTSAAAAGEIRQALREHGWRTDLAWAEVGARSTGGPVTAAGGGQARRTIAYLPVLRALDGGALRIWREGDVAAPAVADVREVMVATEGVDDWTSETFEVPPLRVENAPAPADAPAATPVAV